MTDTLDLLGTPVLRRRANFLRAGVRLTLTRDWAPGPRALVIGCNPSEADALRGDPTSRWWNRWFAGAGFGGYDAANLYPFCTPSPAECRRIVDGIAAGDWEAMDALYHTNVPEVVRLAKTADQVFVCWGAIAWDPVWINHVVYHIQSGAEPWPDLWCWGTTKDGAPKHPLARGLHRIDPNQRAILWRAA